MIGERIREVREKKGITQSALAQKLGLSRSAVNAWEMGVSVPSAQYLIELSRRFSVSTDYLLGIDRRETLDITFLDADEKNILYALLSHFEQRHQAAKVLDTGAFARLEGAYRRLKSEGANLPDEISEIFDEMFE